MTHSIPERLAIFATHLDDAGLDTLAGSPADVVDLPTAETDTTKVLAPDGLGGVEFRAETGGGSFDPLGAAAAAQAAAEAASDPVGTAAAAVAALSSVYQPLDSDLTSIAALSTTTFGRALLALADAAAGRTALGLGTAATHATGDYDAAGAAAAAAAASDPAGTAAAAISALGLGTASTHAAGDFDTAGAAAAAQAAAIAASQPVDSDLTSIAALTTTAYGRAFLALADAAAARTALALGTAATSATSDFDAAGAAAAAQAASQPLDSDLTALAGLAIAADTLPYGTGSHTMGLATFTAAGRALVDDATAADQRTTLGLGTAAVAATGDFDAAGVAASAIVTHDGLADPHAGYVLESLIDAAGDLIVGTADNTVGRLAKGADATVLTVDPTTHLLVWATPAGGAPSGAASGDLGGTFPGPTVLQASGAFAFPGDITPAILAASVDDYNPTGLSTASILRQACNAGKVINGLAGGSDGRLLIVYNSGGQLLQLTHAAGTSTAANRFACPNNTSILIVPGGLCLIVYDATLSRWIPLGSASTFGSGTVTQAFGDAASSGTGFKWAADNHVHGMPNLGTGAADAAAGNDSRLSDSRAPTVHGASLHSDITRNVFLPAAQAKLDSATAANVGASPDLTGVVAYADAATSGALWTFQVPLDWASGVITLQPVWSPGSSDGTAHTVRWSIIAKTAAAGTTVTAAGTTVTFTGASAARTAGVLVYDTATSTTLTPAAAGDLFRFELRRIGADAADTYVGVVNLLGVIATYTANQ